MNPSSRLLLISAAILIGACSEPNTFAAAPDLDAAAQTQRAVAFPATIDLPNGFAPEGIAIGAGTTFYVGSLAGGGIYRGDLRTGAGSLLVEPPGTAAVGMAFDARSGLLFVTSDLEARVYDGATGALAGTFPFPGVVLPNDVVVTRSAAYFTDSGRPVLYRLQLGPDGSLPEAGAIEELPLSGDYVFYPNAPTPYGINNNGIEASPDGSHLFIANMVDGALYAVDAATGYAAAVELEGEPLVFSDGYALDGKDLYVSLGDRIAVVRLGPDYANAAVTRYITDSRFDFVSTIASFGASIYAVNARFATPPAPDVPYSVVAVPKE